MVVESIIVQNLMAFCVRTPTAPSSVFAIQALLEMAKIARILTSVQQAVINVRSTPYVLILLARTTADVKEVSEEMQGKNAHVSFVKHCLRDY